MITPMERRRLIHHQGVGDTATLDVMTDVWPLADSLVTLSAGELEVQSLCDAWKVRDVAAHLAWGNTNPPMSTVLAVVKGDFRANRVNARLGQEWGRRNIDTIVARPREIATRRVITLGTKPVDALSDALCQDLDVREPLGKPGPMPA
jgi:hypothetical protein